MTTSHSSQDVLLQQNAQLRLRIAELEARLGQQGEHTGANVREERLRYLAEVGQRLSHSLDPQQTLADLARLAVPTLGDWCAVYLPKGDGTLEPLVVHHSQPEKIELVYTLLRGNPIRVDAENGSGAAFRTGEPKLFPVLTDAMFEGLAIDPERLDMLKKLELRSGMNLPMVARGQVLGVIDVVSSDVNRRYTDADIALGMEFAQRVAMALDNARLYTELRKANELFALAEAGSGGYVYEWDAHTGILERSANFVRVMGYADLSVAVQAWQALIHPNDRQHVDNLGEAALKAGTGYSLEYRARHADGHYVHLWDRGTVIRSADGKTARIIGSAVDITERKRAEMRLQALQQVTSHLLLANTPRAVAEVVLRDGLRVAGAAVGSVYLHADGQIELVALEGFTKAVVQGYERLPLDADLPIAEAARSGKPVYYTNRETRIEQFPHLATALANVPYEAAAYVPLHSNGNNLGAISLFFVESREFSAEERAFIQTLAEQAAQALERARLFEDLRESEASLSTMADAMPQLVWIADASGAVTYYNRRAKEYAGLTQIGQSTWVWQPVVHPDEMAATTQTWADAVNAVRPYVMEHRLRLADGSYRWHLSRAYPARDINGNVYAWFGTATDIHDLKEAEAEQEIVNYRFRVAEEAAKGFSYDWDIPTDTVTRSDSLKRILGYTPAELGSNWDSWRVIVDPADGPADKEAAIAFLSGQPTDTVDAEYRVRDKHGDEHWMHERAMLLRDEHGQLIRVIGQTVDITERKATEKRLRESEARFRQLADATPVLVWISDTTKACTYFNYHWLQFTGRTLEQEAGRGWLEGVHPDDVERCFQAYSTAFDRREAFEIEYRLRQHNGCYRWILNRGVPNHSPDGTFVGYISGCIDIQDRWQAEQDDRFLASVGVLMNSAGSPDELMTQVVTSIATHLGVARAGFNEVDAAQDIIVFHRDYAPGLPSVTGSYQLSSFGRALAEEMRAGKTMMVNDTLADPRTAGEYGLVYGPAHLGAILSVPMMRNGEWVASLWVAAAEAREWSWREAELLHTLVERAWLAVETARVQAETQALNATLEGRVAERTQALLESQEQLRQLTTYVERAREDERTRIAREVHDELGGALTVMKMSVARAAKGRAADADLTARLDDMRTQIDVLVQAVRRISYDLRPSVLDDFGLLAAMEWQVHEWERRTGIVCDLDLPRDVELTLSHQSRTAVFRAFQESLTNVARHSQASQVDVKVRLDADKLVLIVRDNGRGISADALRPGKSLGLLGMRERMREVAGSVTITGQRDAGTTVEIHVPLEPLTIETIDD